MTDPTQLVPPVDINPADPDQLEAAYQKLLDRPLDSVEALQQWLLECSALGAVVDEHGSRLYIQRTCHTDDEDIERRFLEHLEQVEPRLKPLLFAMQKKYVECPHRRELPAEDFAVLDRTWETDVALFRPENVPLEIELAKLSAEYDKICGAMTVEFDGKTRTLPQLRRYLEQPERGTREKAWRAEKQRRLADAETIETLYEKQLALRQQVARQADCDGYRDFVWKQYHRFDYTPDDCIEFAESVASSCLPWVGKLFARKAEQLGVDQLRPWDLEVDSTGQGPLEPFPADDVETFVAKTQRVLAAVDASLGEQFTRLKIGTHLDLDSRLGKQPGGYQAPLEATGEPFIFMNAAGAQDDVITLLHEAGHAFHFMAAAADPLIFRRHAPTEFCEVASMSMELLAAPHFELLYDDPADAVRARRELFERCLTLLPWIVSIDQFQHWIYSHPGHSVAERHAKWTEIYTRFAGPVDFTGLDREVALHWQHKIHLFAYPFYYVEYGIAQLGALQVWQRAQQDAASAVADYRRALALAGRAPLPELFAAAGIRFDFSEATIRPLMEALAVELELT